MTTKVTRLISKAFIMLIVLLSLTNFITATSAYSFQPSPAGKLYVSEDGINFYSVDEEYPVFPGNQYWIQVRCLPCLAGSIGDTIEIRVTNEGWGRTVQIISCGESICTKCTEPFTWTCPEDAQFCTKYTVEYRKPQNQCTCLTLTWTAKGTMCKPGYLHVIPEYALGTITPMLAMIFGTMIYTKYRKK